MMKITKVKHISNSPHTSVKDCEVGAGYYKAGHGSLPDIDSDFAADKRGEVKAYLERRYNKNGLQRVFSAGTFTTMKIRSVITDVARVHKVPVASTKYITAIIDDSSTWTDVMKLAHSDKRVREYIQKYPEVFEECLPLMNQTRSSGIHASAIVITPEYVKGERVDCYDLLPVRKMDDLLVSEISGADVDAIGILKNDVLGIQELTRLANVLELIKQEYSVTYTILQIATQYLNDPKVFEVLRAGNTQGVFQMSGQGITRYIKQMAPDNINDLIASVALFRPGTLNSGAAQGYVDCKNGVVEPQYLWGTYEILKDTFGHLCYQEQQSLVARKIGNLSLGDGVNLVKALSKKKLEKVRKFKDKFFQGAEDNHCPKEAADKIWSAIEDAAKYSFNKSHATAYGLTAYVGAWLKTHYPMPFYSVILGDVDEDKLPTLMNEMRSVGGAEIVAPDINISGVSFTPNYKLKKIYWSLTRISMLGPKAVDYIVKERNRFGDFVDLEEFIHRIFRKRLMKFKDWDDPADGTEWDDEKCPVNARHIRNLIYSGAFDRVNNVQSICERYGLLKKASEILGFDIPEKEIPEGMADKHYFWSQQQINIAGIGSVDYWRIWNNLEKPESARRNRYIKLSELSDMFLDATRGAICATIAEVSDKTYKSAKDGTTKHFGKITLQQNTDIATLTIWDSAWSELKPLFWKKEGTIIAAVCGIKFSDYDEKNVLSISKNSFVKAVV